MLGNIISPRAKYTKFWSPKARCALVGKGLISLRALEFCVHDPWAYNVFQPNDYKSIIPRLQSAIILFKKYFTNKKFCETITKSSILLSPRAKNNSRFHRIFFKFSPNKQMFLWNCCYKAQRTQNIAGICTIVNILEKIFLNKTNPSWLVPTLPQR